MVVVDAITLQSMENTAIHASSENEPNTDRDNFETAYERETLPRCQYLNLPLHSDLPAKENMNGILTFISLKDKQISLVTEFTSDPLLS